MSSSPEKSSCSWEILSNEQLLHSIESWLGDQPAETLQDMLCIAAFHEMIHGVSNGVLRNGLLDGGLKQGVPEDLTPAGIDCNMQRLLGLQLLQHDDGCVYILWHDFARRAQLRRGTNIYSAMGPLYCVPKSVRIMATPMPPTCDVEDAPSSQQSLERHASNDPPVRRIADEDCMRKKNLDMSIPKLMTNGTSNTAGLQNTGFCSKKIHAPLLSAVWTPKSVNDVITTDSGNLKSSSFVHGTGTGTVVAAVKLSPVGTPPRQEDDLG